MLVQSSDFFKKALTVPMKVSLSNPSLVQADVDARQKKKEQKIDLSDKDAYAVQDLLRWLYRGDFNEFSGNNPDQLEGPLVVNARVYGLADYCQVNKALKDLAIEKMKFLLIHRNGDFVPAVLVIYNATPSKDRGLRDLAADHASDKYIDLSLQVSFQAVMNEITVFAADVARLIADKFRPMRNVKMVKCAPSGGCCSTVTAVDMSVSTSAVTCRGCGRSITLDHIMKQWSTAVAPEVRKRKFHVVHRVMAAVKGLDTDHFTP